jgi:hypothetical protein
MRTGLQSRGNIVGDAQSQIMLHQKLRDILLVWCCFAIAGCLNQPVNGPVSKAQISLNQARRIRADAKMAIGYYLDAADSALSSAKSSSSTSSADSQATYNGACQEMAVRLQANPGLWNRNATVSAEDHTYRLKFTSGSRQAGVWDSSYFDDLHTPRQLRRRFRLLPRGKNGWGGVLVGVHRPAAPRKYFLPPHGLAVPVTAAVDFTPVGSRNSDRTLNARFTLYDPAKRETIRMDGAKRQLAADFTARYSYYPNPSLLPPAHFGARPSSGSNPFEREIM